jgi:hypothetical protein
VKPSKGAPLWPPRGQQEKELPLDRGETSIEKELRPFIPTANEG